METPQNLLVVAGLALVSTIVAGIAFAVYTFVGFVLEYFVKNPRLPGGKKEL